MPDADPISLTCQAMPEGTRAAAFQAVEGISRPYEVEVFVVAPSDELDPAAVIGQSASLMVHADGGATPMRFSGTIATFDLLHDHAGMSLGRAVIVPRLWLLGLSRHSRMFTKASIVDVITAVLDDAGITEVDRQLGSYPAEEHVCQYRESDLAFLSRWMEREGIFYWFEHGEDGEKLVLRDAASYADDALGVSVGYQPQVDGAAAATGLRGFKSRYATLPASVRLRDYDYAKPTLDVSGSAQVSATGVGEVSLHGRRFFTPDDGARLAKLRAEELLARGVVFQGHGRRLHLRPGATFDLEGHPRAEFNAEYLTIEARHYGRQPALSPFLDRFVELEHDESYLVEVDAIPASTAFRPACRTPWPRIDGFEHGTVDGPADSEYAQLDDQGRYAVKLAFDESDLDGGGASTLVRMMQPHGGGTEGFHFPLRKGTEVLIAFLAGDPDRPVISGVVPNAQTPSPVTSANKTLNVVQTGGFNRLELDDQAGEERIALSTPHADTYLRMGHPQAADEVELHTAKNGFFSMGETLAVDVGLEGGKGDYLLSIRDHWTSSVEKGNYALSVDEGTFSTTVKGDSTHTVQSGNTKIATESGTTDISSAQTVTIASTAGDFDVRAINASTQFTGGCDWLVMGNKLDTTIGLSETFALSNALSVTVGATESLFIGGSLEVSAAEKVSIDVGLSQAFTLAGQLDVYVGTKEELALSAAASLHAGVSIDMFMGLKLATEVALAVNINVSLALEMNVFQYETDAAGKVTMTPLELKMNGLTMIN